MNHHRSSAAPGGTAAPGPEAEPGWDGRSGPGPATGAMGAGVAESPGTAGLCIAEDLLLRGVAPEPLAEALRDRLFPGALVRAEPEGLALDLRLRGAADPVWPGPALPVVPMTPPERPDHERTAECLRFADALALRLGLGRGFVMPVFETDPDAAAEPAGSYAAAGAVPVAAFLSLAHDVSGWTGFRPLLRQGDLHVAGSGGPLRARLAAGALPDERMGHADLLFRPLARPGCLAVDLPLELPPAAVEALLGPLAEIGCRLGISPYVEGRARPDAVQTLRIRRRPGGLALGLPFLPCAGPEASGLRLQVLSEVVSGLGGEIRPQAGRLRLCGDARPVLSLWSNLLRHPVLTRLWRPRDVGPCSRFPRLDEAPGDVAAAARAALTDPAHGLTRLATLGSGGETVSDGDVLSLPCGAADPLQHRLLGAVAGLPGGLAEPSLPLGAYALPAVLEADLDAVCARLGGVGTAVDRPSLSARLARVCPRLLRVERGPVVLEIRRALLERRLPGDWEAVHLELRLLGVPGGVALAAGPAGARMAPLPTAALGRMRLASVTLPLTVSWAGPFAGRFPLQAIDLALSVPGGTRIALRLDGRDGWRRIEAAPLPEPDCCMQAGPVAALDRLSTPLAG